MRCPTCKRKLPFDDETQKLCSACGWSLKNELDNTPVDWPSAELPFPQGDPLLTDELEAFTHESPDEKRLERPYYLTKWRGILNGTTSHAGYNWAAWLTGAAWIAYRKQFGMAALYYAIEVLAVSFVSIVTGLLTRYSPVGSFIRLPLSILAYMLLRVPIAFLANKQYLRKAIVQIQKVRGRQSGTTERLVQLKKLGGTSGAAVAVVVVVNVLVNGVILIVTR